MIRNKVLILLLFTNFISAGCTTFGSVKGPSGVKFDLTTVCNTSAKSRCAPTVGEKVPLTDQQIVMEVLKPASKLGPNESIQPDLSTYLGTIIPKSKNILGEPGTYCGTTHVATNPFMPDDFTKEPVYKNTANIREFIGTDSKTSIEVDLIAALKSFNVSDKVINKLKSDISIQAEKLSLRGSASKVKFVEYRIKEEVLRKLEMSYLDKTGKNKYSDCMNTLLEKKNNSKELKWQMYQALSGFIVDENDSVVERQSSFTSRFALEVDFKDELEKALDKEGMESTKTQLNLNENTSEILSCNQLDDLLNNNRNINNSKDKSQKKENAQDSEKTLSLQRVFNKLRCNSTNAKSEKYFVIIGVSFWRSPRFHLLKEKK